MTQSAGTTTRAQETGAELTEKGSRRPQEKSLVATEDERNKALDVQKQRLIGI